MAVEILVLSGARHGQRVVVDRPAFAVGDGPGCEVPFDPSQDPDVRGRRVEFVFDEEGWRIRNAGEGEPLVNVDPLIGEQRIRNGDIVRLSEFGPDFSFALLFGQTAPQPQRASPTPMQSTAAPETKPAVSTAPIVAPSPVAAGPAPPQRLSEAWRSMAPESASSEPAATSATVSPDPVETKGAASEATLPTPHPAEAKESRSFAATVSPQSQEPSPKSAARPIPARPEQKWEDWEERPPSRVWLWASLAGIGLLGAGTAAALWLMPGEPIPPPAPTLPRFPTFTINESEPWSVSVAAIGWSEKHPPLTYRLEKGPPGATLEEETGTIRWMPGESQGPGEHTLIVSAEPKDAPQQAARTTLEVMVRETPQKPRIAPLAAQTVVVSQELSLRIQAEDLDEPPSNLAWYLGRGAPQGARIQSSTGRLTWTPTPDQQGEAAILIEVRKADAPLVVSTATLRVTVTAPP